MTRILWDRDEAVIMLAALIDSRSGKISRQESVEYVSSELRKRAVSRGMEIDDRFRNKNGIMLQMSHMESILTNGKEGLKKEFPSKLFTDVVSIYNRDPAEFYKLLEEVKGVSREKTLKEHFFEWLASKVSPEQLPELYTVSNDLMRICSIYRLRGVGIFETGDLSDAEALFKNLLYDTNARVVIQSRLKGQLDNAQILLLYYCTFLHNYPELAKTFDSNLSSTETAAASVQSEAGCLNINTSEIKDRAEIEPAAKSSELEQNLDAANSELPDEAEAAALEIHTDKQTENTIDDKEKTVSVSAPVPANENFSQVETGMTPKPDEGGCTDEESAAKEPEQSDSVNGAINARIDPAPPTGIFTVDFNNLPSVSFTRPVFFSYYGVEHSDITRWVQIYLLLVKNLYKTCPESIGALINKSIVGNVRLDFADEKNSKTMTNPRKIADNFYLESNYSANNILSRMKKLLDICKVNYSCIVVRYCSTVNGIESTKPDEIPAPIVEQTPMEAGDEELVIQERENFVKWMADTGLSQNMVSDYVASLCKCDKAAREYNLSNESLWMIKDVGKLTGIKRALFAIPEFAELNKQRHNSLSAAFGNLLGSRLDSMQKVALNENADDSRSDEEELANYSAIETDTVLSITDETAVEEATASATTAEEVVAEEAVKDDDLILQNESADMLQQNIVHEEKSMQRDDRISEPIIMHKDMSLSEAEAKISAQISKVEYWGDLQISASDYELLKQALWDYKAHEHVTIGVLLTRYPLCMVTVAVFIARYEYNGDFWGPFTAAFNEDIPANEQSVLGKKILAIMRCMGFDVDSKTYSRKYVDAIIHQACLPPQSNFAGFFYALSTNSNHIFDPEELLDELQSERAYLLHEPAKHFLEEFQDTRAIDFLVELHENAVAVDSGVETNEPTANLYREWKAREKAQNRGRSKDDQALQLHPYLAFDNEGKGLCVVLPDFILSDEWVTEAKWEISGAEGFEWTGQNRVFEKDGRRYIRERYVSVQPQSKFSIKLTDAEIEEADEKPLFEGTVQGVAEDGILIFDSTGRLVRGNYLTTRESTLVAGALTCLYPNSSLQMENQYYPNQGDYGFFTLKAYDSDAQLIWQDKLKLDHKIAVRTHTTMSCEGQTIFGVPARAGEIPAFVCAPGVAVNGDKPSGMRVYLDGQELDLSEPIGDEAQSLIHLPDNIALGRHSVRAYCGGRFLCMTEFYLFPEIHSNYEPDLQWTGNVSQPRTITFELPENCKLELDELEAESGRDNKVRVDCPEGLGELSGNVILLDKEQRLCAHFHLPLSPVSVALVDAGSAEEANDTLAVHNYSLNEFEAGEPWLTVKFRSEYIDKGYQVQLVSVDGIVQSAQLSVSRDCARLNLGIFKDSLAHMPLPAILQLVCLEHPDLPLRILRVEEKTEFLTRPRVIPQYFMFQASENLPDDLLLEITRYGSQQSSTAVLLSCKNKKLDKKREWWGIPLQQALSDGIYFVRTQTENFSFFDEAPRNNELLKSRNNVFLIQDGKTKLPKEIVSAEDLINHLISDYLCGVEPVPEKSKAVFWVSNAKAALLTDAELSDADFEKLIALSEFASMDSTSKKWKRALEKAMRYIGLNVLGPASRYKLLQKIAHIGCSENAFGACWQHYSLYPFAQEISKDDSDALARAIAPYSDELALVMLLHSGKSIQQIFGIRRFWDLVGENALLSFITVSEPADESSARLAQRSFLYERPLKGVVIQMDAEITGRQELLSQMIERDGFIARINYQKAPNTGKVFDRITYADLYTNWLRINDRDLDSGEGDNSWKKPLMINAVKRYQDILVGAVKTMSYAPGTARYVGNYFNALAKRKSESCMSTTKNVVSRPRFFYLEGVAAFLCAAHSYFGITEPVFSAAQGYMVYSVQVAPRMAQRDMLCAETYLYLKTKEIEICQ